MIRRAHAVKCFPSDGELHQPERLNGTVYLPVAFFSWVTYYVVKISEETIVPSSWFFLALTWRVADGWSYLSDDETHRADAAKLSPFQSATQSKAAGGASSILIRCIVSGGIITLGYAGISAD